MSRSSDTRQRTREAAAQLVAGGKRPHEITVDLIYAEIQQGSRTTINDELKAWKDERTKVDALGADLPPAIADSMRSLWVAAVEQGEQVFAERRAELEAEVERANERETVANTARETAEASGRELAHQLGTLREQMADLQRRIATEIESKNEASRQALTLQQELTALRTESAHQLEVVRQEQDRQTSEFQQAIAERDAAFRAELDTATHRLESAQANMLQQIDDARTAQRRAEGRASETLQRVTVLADEATTLRLQLAAQQQDAERYRQTNDRLGDELTAMRQESGVLSTANSELRGRHAAMAEQLDTLEARALRAEQGLLNALAHRPAKRATRDAGARQS
jgi:chromosome segregation ATPase